MRYLSLFSGIGGFEKGIEQAYETLHQRPAGTKEEKDGTDRPCPDHSGEHARQSPACVGFSEIDPYAVNIYQKHYPNHKNYGDITKISADALPDFDLLVGGFPCPSFSIAGKRKGLDDLRGQLIFDVIRILRAKRPKNFVLENVKGILSHDSGKTMEIICEELCESGYAIDFEVLNSKDFGVQEMHFQLKKVDGDWLITRVETVKTLS